MTKLILKRRHIDTIYLSVALLVYAFFSSSTPDRLGVPEMIIACFLVLFVGAKSAVLSFYRAFTPSVFLPQYLYIVFWLLLFVPLAVGVLVTNNKIGDIARDILPYLYLFLPILFAEKMKTAPDYWSKVLLVLISIIGVSFSIRHVSTVENSLALIGAGIIRGNNEYFPMDPAVLFTATILLLIGIKKILVDKKVTRGALITLVGAIAYLSILSILVRAQIILVLFAVVVYSLYLSKLSVFRMVVIILAFIVVIIYNYTQISGLLEMVLGKFSSAGLSNRDLEFIAVFDNLSQSTPKALFGEGWGGLIQSPTSPGVKIRFTHNIFNYFLLKSGFVGLAILLYFFYILSLGFKVKITNSTLYMHLTLFNIVVVHLLLEPGFKMMSIGLIITYFILYSKKANYA